MIRHSACRICWGAAIQKGVYGNVEEISCEGCGRYLINRNWSKDHLGKAFDVEQMRIWLGAARKAGRVPYVNDENAAWRQRPKAEVARWPGWSSGGLVKRNYPTS
jgi:hypothetical protein